MVLIARLAVLGVLTASAHESASSHYSNLSLGGAQQTSSPAPKKALDAPKSAAPRAARPVQPAPAPAAPAPAPQTAPFPRVAAALVALAAAATAYAAYRRRRRDREALVLAAHELKSPLAAIESYLDLISTEASEQGPQARRWLEDFARMRSTAAHLRRTIGDILDMTRVEDGTIKLAIAKLDAAALARESAASFAPLAAEGGRALNVDAASGLPRALGDAGRVRQILDNLLSNALKYSPKNGRVLVRIRADGPNVVLSVIDEGAGIPPAQRHRLFGKFARFGRAEDGTEGTGLGLYLSRLLARAQGGALEHRPGASGRGSEFVLTLPASEGA